jgi:hypothetical protein
MQLADFLELDAQAMTQRAFRSKLFQQRFRPFKSVRRNVLALEQIAKTTLNFRFGKQGNLLTVGPPGRTTILDLNSNANPERGLRWTTFASKIYSIAHPLPCKSSHGILQGYGAPLDRSGNAPLG